MEKAILLIIMLATSGCGTIETAALITTVVHRGSKAGNHMSGGVDGETLTENDYQACKKGDNAACARSDFYSIVFFPADTIYTTFTGRPDLIGSSHGEIWHEIDKKLPTISNVQPSYGKRNYNQFIEKRR